LSRAISRTAVQSGAILQQRHGAIRYARNMNTTHRRSVMSTDPSVPGRAAAVTFEDLAQAPSLLDLKNSLLRRRAIHRFINAARQRLSRPSFDSPSFYLFS
jgi:hypothetical protein